jgi:hypothetical protein
MVPDLSELPELPELAVLLVMLVDGVVGPDVGGGGGNVVGHDSPRSSSVRHGHARHHRSLSHAGFSVR